MAVTDQVMNELEMDGRTNAQKRKKALEILKKFKVTFRKRNSTGQGDRADGVGIPLVYRYNDLVKVCGSRVVLPLEATLVTLGEAETTEAGAGDNIANTMPPAATPVASDSTRPSLSTLPPPAPSTSGGSRPASMSRPIRRIGQPTTLLHELRQLDANERMENAQDRAINERNLEEKKAERLLRERELEEKAKMRALMEKKLEFEIRKWEHINH